MSEVLKGLNTAIIPPSLDDSEVQISQMRAASLRRRIWVYALRVAFLVVVIGGWELLSRTYLPAAWQTPDRKFWIDPFYWGQPWGPDPFFLEHPRGLPRGILDWLVQWVQQGTSVGPLWEQILATLQEAVYGFLIGVGLGVVFGVVLGTNRFIADVLGPFIKAANSIPRVVLGSVFVIAIGFDIQSKVALAVVLVFFIVFFNAFQGVREVDRNLLANARILGASRFQLTTSVIIPAALTWIIASLHTAFSFALVGAVVGEYLGALKGIGLMIQTAQGNFNNNGVFACIVILSVLALTAETLITWLENRLIRWRPNVSSDATL